MKNVIVWLSVAILAISILSGAVYADEWESETETVLTGEVVELERELYFEEDVESQSNLEFEETAETESSLEAEDVFESEDLSLMGDPVIDEPVSYNGITEPRADWYYSTWDCIWYGSYPQVEVFASENDLKYVKDRGFRKDYTTEDAIVNLVLYRALENASWDANGDTVIDGFRYHRMLQSDCVGNVSSYLKYQWKDDSTYHYFRYEPIKWRVLSLSASGKAMLIADKCLDVCSFTRYNQEGYWETSKIRSWLNEDFLNTAFSAEEASNIISTQVKSNYYTTSCTTVDKVYLLAEKDTEKYGFYNIHNDGFPFVASVATGYAWARGAKCSSGDDSLMYATYILRDHPNAYFSDFTLGDVPRYINEQGRVGMTVLQDTAYAVRPIINIELSVASYSYAGTVVSTGEVNECGRELVVSGLQALPNSKNSVVLTWQACQGAEGYLIYGYHGSSKNGAKYSYIGMTKDVSKVHCTYIDNAASDDYNFYFVYPYVYGADGKMQAGKCCKYTYAKGGSVYKLPAVTDLKAKSMLGGVSLTWTKVQDAEGYLIYGFHGSPKKGATYGYIGMTDNSVFFDANAKKGQYNFYYVFPYHTNSEGEMVPGCTAPYVYGFCLTWG